MTFQKITKARAKALHKAGQQVYILASKLVPCNHGWGLFIPSAILPYEDMETHINEYRYYNCNHETGMGINYYMQEEV